MAQEEEQAPKVEEVEFPGKLVTSLESIKSKLLQIPFYTTKLNSGELNIIRVESWNVHKMPFLFYIIKIKQDSLTMTYSIIPNTSERIRRATALGGLSAVISIISDDFKINEAKFFQYIDSAIGEILNGMSESYSALFNKYDALVSNYAELRKLTQDLNIANRNMTIQTSQLSEENKTLQEQLHALQTYSDDALMAMVQDWIEVHNSSIDITEFAKTYKLTEPRVEQILDKMVSQGYVELKS